MCQRKIEHLVKITIIQTAIPTHGERVPAHDTGGGGGVECVGKPFHVGCVIAAVEQEFQKAADGHIGDGIQPVESDVIATGEFPAKMRFNTFLFRRQECSGGIVDQIQREAAAVPSIAQFIQQP